MSINAAIKTMMETDIAATVSDWSATLEYKGQSVVGTLSANTGTADLDANQFLDKDLYTFVCVASLFVTESPQHRSVVKVEGINFCVLDRVDDPAAITFTLERSVDRTPTQGIV